MIDLPDLNTRNDIQALKICFFSWQEFLLYRIELEGKEIAYESHCDKTKSVFWIKEVQTAV